MKFRVLLLFFLIINGVFSQQVPHTPTLPGLSSSPFPYVPPNEVGISTEKLELLRQELISWVEHEDVVGNEILIIKNGKIIFHETFGWSDMATGKPVTRNSFWNIRSMTKPITATAIMILVEEGKLSLNDKVTAYIPEFKGNSETTIGHMLSHTSGYSSNDFSDYDEYESVQTLEDWVKAGASKKPTGTYGEYEYTDFGFVVSAYIIEKITGTTLKEFIEQQIIAPLGLQNTRVNFSDDPEWRKRINTWYILNEDTKEYEINWPTDREPWLIFGGAWGMFSTVFDYAIFLACFENNGVWNEYQLLQKENIELMLSPIGYSNKIPMYGYGWMLQSSNTDQNSILNFGHRGGDALAGYVFPKEDLIVIYMSHSRGGIHREPFMAKLGELGLVTYTTYAGKPIRPSEYEGEIFNLSQTDQNPYIGNYQDIGDNGELCDIFLSNNNLVIQLYSTGQKTKRTLDLVHIGNEKFAIGDYIDGKLDWLNPDAIIQFGTDEDKKTFLEFKYRDRLILKAIKKE